MSFPRDWLVGAAANCDIRIDEPKVSSRHAILREQAGRVFVLDLSSSNGTWLRGIRVGADPLEVDRTESIGLGSLQVATSQLLERRRTPAATRELTVGADAQCDVHVNQPQISSRHLKLSTCGDRVWLEDLGSSNGTFVGGERVGRRDLRPTDQVRLGTAIFDWQAALSARSAPVAVMAFAQSWVIGSAPEADICIDAPMVSSRHARLSRADDGAWWIEDLASRNGVFVDGQKVSRIKLDPDGELSLGSRAVSVRWVTNQTKSAVLLDKVMAVESVIEREQPKALEKMRARYQPPPSPPSQRLAVPFLAVTAIALASGGAWWFTQGRDPAPNPPTPDVRPPVVPGPNNGDWQPAWALLATTTKSTAQPDQGEQILGALRLEDGNTTPEQRFHPPEHVVDFLREHEQARATYDKRNYGTGFQASGHVGGQVGSATAAEGDFVVPNLDKLPIRNQGQRGTCAAFAAIGNIEAAVLQSAPQLTTVDLSEQHFYWLSKPRCQNGSCGHGQEGSSFEEGFAICRQHSGLDIPDEGNCPYVSEFRSNDTQSPQAEACSHGSADVRTSHKVIGAQGLIDALRKYRLPIPIGTKLSASFMEGESLISIENSSKEAHGMHADGHGYLVVGYKRMPDKPEEGGVCFIIRNSWGRGWGRGGYSCVTQAWLQAFWEDPETTMVTEVELGPELAPKEPLPPVPTPKPRPEPKPAPQPAPAPPGPIASEGHLRGSNGSNYAASWHSDGKTAEILLQWRDNSAPGRLTLQQRKRQLYQDDVAVGRIDGDLLYLCSGPFSSHCQLLATTATPRQVKVAVAGVHAAPHYGSTGKTEQWLPVVATPDGGQLQALPGGSATSLSVRVRYVPAGGGPTPEVEFTFQDGRLLFGGRTVGSIRPDEIGLCTGQWASACELFGSEDGLVVLRRPKAE